MNGEALRRNDQPSSLEHPRNQSKDNTQQSDVNSFKSADVALNPPVWGRSNTRILKIPYTPANKSLLR